MTDVKVDDILFKKKRNNTNNTNIKIYSEDLWNSWERMGLYEAFGLFKGIGIMPKGIKFRAHMVHRVWLVIINIHFNG